MKKITLSAITLFLSTFAIAQNSYTLTASQGTYTDLVNPVSINNNQYWDYDEFEPITLPFNVNVFGHQYTKFVFQDDSFYLVDSNFTGFEDDEDMNYTMLDPISAFIQDRSTNWNSSLSPISYKTEGSTGNRILKLEIKNAGLEDEYWENETLNSYLNYQIWIYENTNKIEYHFGPSYVSNILYLNGENLILSYFGTITSSFFKAAYLTGQPTNPVYNETTDSENIPAVGLTSIPQNGQIYSFSNTPLSTEKADKINFSIYPIPVENNLNVSLTEIGNYKYEVIDIIGKTILNGELTNVSEFTINTNNLNSGTYLIKINNTTKKFIKK